MAGSTPPLKVILRAAGLALAIGLSVAFVLAPASGSPVVRGIELIAVIALGVLALAAVLALVTGWLAGWRDGEAEFEMVVRRAERLASDNLAAEPGEGEFLELDPLRDEDFEELVRDALDELPDLLQNALAHVAVVISDGGRRAHAYGLYQGDGAHREDHPDRIVIFRDTLRRDFGDDAELLREQVVRVVRHELAHHVGFDEMGVGELGL
ncbi:MAG TPA: metallopeptidase family protein [Solirubrobacteraceae bacterium]|nr:metallopeptidase family protein [Solirubrobacteraceae bacterium]